MSIFSLASSAMGSNRFCDFWSRLLTKKPKAPLTSVKDLKDVLFVVAMEAEEKEILNGHSYREVTVSGALDIRVKRMVSGNRRIWILRTGVGSVNSAIGVAKVLDTVPLDAVVLLGVGGAVSPNLKVGDVVISKNVIQHDAVYSHADGNELMAAGELHLSLPKEERPPIAISAHPVLTDWVLQTLKSSGLKGQVYSGTVLSGSEFAGTPERKTALRNLDENALMVEMEAAGIAQVAKKANLPFVVVKTIADTVSPDRSVGHEYVSFLEHACRVAGTVTRSLGEQP